MHPSSPVAAPAPSPKKHPILKFLAGFFLGLTVAGSAGGAYVLHMVWQQLPEVDHLADYDPMLPMRIYARDGTLLAEYGEERREFVPIGQIPLQVRQALLAIEDARFYEHGAVDFTGLARAALRNVVSGEHVQGASTITMQVARVFFLSRVKTYSRKLMEILLAYKLEATYSKDKILELYMNQIYLGERAYGFAAAASVYFDKTLDELTVAEAAVLAPRVGEIFNGAIVEVAHDDPGKGTVIVRDPAIEASVSGSVNLPLGADVRVSLVEADPVRRVTRFELAG